MFGFMAFISILIYSVVVFYFLFFLTEPSAFDWSLQVDDERFGSDKRAKGSSFSKGTADSGMRRVYFLGAFQLHHSFPLFIVSVQHA